MMKVMNALDTGLSYLLPHVDEEELETLNDTLAS